MNYYEYNGVGSSSTKSSQSKRNPGQEMNNINWLLYTMYARQDFEFCKLIIEHQLEDCYDREYLYFINALILREEDDMQGALKSFQKAIELNPKNPMNYKEVAKTLYKMGRLRQSLEIFLKAEQFLERTDNELYFYIGDLLLKNYGQPRGGIAEAKEYFNRAIKNGKHLESYNKLAEIFIKENDIPKAIEMLECSLQIYPDSGSILTQIGILYLTMKNIQNAFTKFLEALNLDEKCSKALIALGAILQSKNDVDGALNKYKKVNDADQDCTEIWSNIGMCFFKKQKFIAAIACLKKSVWISPLNFNSLYNLGYVLLTAQQFAMAFHALAAAINIKPDNAECFMLLGICLRNLNDRGNALLAFERSIMLPDAIKNPLIYLNFAIFCNEMEKIEESHLYLSNFMKMSESMSIKKEYMRIAHSLSTILPKPEPTEMENHPEIDTNVDIQNNKEENDISVNSLAQEAGVLNAIENEANDDNPDEIEQNMV